MKKFLALILALVMTLALVACGGGEDAADDGAAESGKTTVTMIAAQYGNETAD